MNDVATIEMEKQLRGQAFLRALAQLEREYNCTTTVVLKWVPGVGETFVAGYDKQVTVGPVPMKPVEEKKKGK